MTVFIDRTTQVNPEIATDRENTLVNLFSSTFNLESAMSNTPQHPKQGKGAHLPIEILESIFKYVASSFPQFNECEDKKDRKLLGHPLHACSLVSKRWYSVSNPLLWRHVMVDNHRVFPFVLSILNSALIEAQTTMEPKNIRKGTVGTVRDVILLIQERIQLISESLIPDRQEYNPLGTFDCLRDLTNGERLKFVPQSMSLGSLTSDDPDWEEREVLFQTLSSSLNTDPFILQFLAMVQAQRRSQYRIAQSEGIGTRCEFYKLSPQIPTQYLGITFGRGHLISKLDIPSRGPFSYLFPLILDFLPNVKSLGFNHPAHGDDFIPTLAPYLIDHFGPLMSNLSTLRVEDVDEDGWVPLITNIEHYGSNMIHLNLEAIPEKDTYKSKKSMSQLFEAITNVQCLRMDGIPISHQDYSPFGGDVEIKRMAQTCTCLRAIILDYCDVTIKSFYTLWNDCPNLEFLGISGVSGTPSMHEPLQRRPNMKTVRLVDCEISDEFVDKVARNAPNLEMIRIVFEDAQAIEDRGISDNLTDELLHSLGKHCLKLRIIAISRFPKMTPEGFQVLCKNPNIQVLDFHTTPHSELGILDSDFFQSLIPFFDHIKSLNLYGQSELTDDDLIKYVTSGKARRLESLCLNNAMIGPTFLENLLRLHEDSLNPSQIGHCPNLQRLSLIGCPALTKDDIEWFLFDAKEKRQSYLPNLKKVHYFVKEGDSLIRDHRLIQVADSWFVDEGLDIFSLWDKEIRKSQHLD